MSDYKIYPKQFQHEKIIIQKNKCFMIMPFDDEFNTVYGIIKSECDNNSISCNRVDEMNGSQPIVNKIIKSILEFQYIIVDITNDKPNVYYELGIAHSFRDANNILILKQKNTTSPFDISHLPYHEYSVDNPWELRSIISSFIKASKKTSDFQDALAVNDIYDYSISGSQNFIEYVEEYFNEDLQIYSYILNKNTATYEYAIIEKAILNFEELVAKTISMHNPKISDGIIQIYIKLISKCENDEISLKYATRFEDTLLQAGIENDDIRMSKQTDLVLELANNNKILDYCIPWIIKYFSRSKSSSIDLNRYKLESFLMNTANENINDAIVNSIFNEDCHIREHMADIIGAKKIKKGYYALSKQLVTEENWFTVGSLIEAIGRVAPSEEGIHIIEEWIDENGNRLLAEKQFFLLKHLLHALICLDSTSKSVNAFLIKFKDYLHENEVGPIN